jgi:hypothetical protein
MNLNFKNYLWKNNIIEKGEYIGISEYIRKEKILGKENIEIEIFENYIIIKGGEEKIFSDILLSIILENEINEWGKSEIIIENKKIILDEDIISIFKKISKEDYLYKYIYISKKNIKWLKNISFYFISPNYSNEYYLNKEIEKDLWR